MDFHLLISAQTLCLAPDLRRTQTTRGHFVVKNVLAKTYLRVSPGQWEILNLFEEPRTVPFVLDRAIRERRCLPLGEFYELILKAVRARILLEPDVVPPRIEPVDWRGAVSPEALARPLAALMLGGIVLSLGFRPALPSSVLSVVAGLAILSAAHSLAAYLTGCLLRGARGAVYHPRWQWLAVPPCFRVDTSDAIMLPDKLRDVILIAEPAVLAAAAGVTTWHQPEWCFVPLLGLMINLRPLLGARFPTLVRLGTEHHPSEAEHGFIFPPNRSPRARWRILVRGLREANTWVRFFYAVIWTLTVVYLAARLTDTPPWTIEFWEANGVRVAIAVGGSLAGLGLGYVVWETYGFARQRGHAWLHAFRQWRTRWFRAKTPVRVEAQRLEAIAGSALLRGLDAAQRQSLAQGMALAYHGPWQSLAEFEGRAPARVALMVSGWITVRREIKPGRTRVVQTLGPGDVIGLHDLADPNYLGYRLRTRTPVTLLTADRTLAAEMILERVTHTPFSNTVLKVPFLRRIALCRNWHRQAIERFAQLSAIIEYTEGSVIFQENQIVDRFFILFDGLARVTREGRELGRIRPGEFFGEIGLLQNSNASASLTAERNARCLAIPRAEFLRFVTHNYAVALELERVSSARLGRPIFPVRQSNFRKDRVV